MQNFSFCGVERPVSIRSLLIALLFTKNQERGDDNVDLVDLAVVARGLTTTRQGIASLPHRLLLLLVDLAPARLPRVEFARESESGEEPAPQELVLVATMLVEEE